MAFLPLVVERRTLLHGLHELGGIQRRIPVQRKQFLCQIEQIASVTIGHGPKGMTGIRVHRDRAALNGLGAHQEFLQRGICKPVEHKDLTS